MSLKPPPADSKDEPGYLLSFALVAILVALLVAGLTRGGAQTGGGTVFMGLFLMAWGLMFLASYWFSHKSAFLRGLTLFCEKLSYPSTRKMAFFYFAVAFVLGFMSVLGGLGKV